MLWHCWLGDRKGIRPVKIGCWFGGGDGLTGALTVLWLQLSVVTTYPIILSSNGIQNGDVLVPAKPDSPGKWLLKRREYCLRGSDVTMNNRNRTDRWFKWSSDGVLSSCFIHDVSQRRCWLCWRRWWRRRRRCWYWYWSRRFGRRLEWTRPPRRYYWSYAWRRRRRSSSVQRPGIQLPLET